jgi:hypothetical protein
MAMGVDHSGDDNHAFGVDYLCAFCTESGADADDFGAANQDVALGKVAQRVIHGDDHATLDQQQAFSVGQRFEGRMQPVRMCGKWHDGSLGAGAGSPVARIVWPKVFI